MSQSLHFLQLNESLPLIIELDSQGLLVLRLRRLLEGWSLEVSFDSFGGEGRAADGATSVLRYAGEGDKEAAVALQRLHIFENVKPLSLASFCQHQLDRLVHDGFVRSSDSSGASVWSLRACESATPASNMPASTGPGQ